jgi:hypothetical protein
MKLRATAALIALGFLVGVGLPKPLVLSAAAQEAQPQELAEPQNGPPAADLPTLEERKRRLGSLQPGADQDLALPEAPDPHGITEETAQRYQDTLRAYYAYRQRGYEHRLRVFEWQFLSSKIIFVVVLVLVFAGIYFAAIQFHAGLRGRGPTREGKATDETTEFVFSLKEFKMRSPVLGVIVLTLSLAFFYLYLVFVYPIENVF